MATLTPLNAASPLDAIDTNRLSFTVDTTETLNRALDNVDGDFSNMDTLSWSVTYRLSAARDDDVYALGIRIVSGATILAAADSGGTFSTVSSSVTNTTDTTSGATAFAYVNTGAGKTLWDAATVELQQTHTKNKGFDGVGIQVNRTNFTGTYTQGAPNTDVPMDLGTFAVTGQTLTINTDDAIAMDAGSFVITGYSGNTSYYIPPLTGAFTLTGHDATASTASNTNVPADLGTFNLAGFDVTALTDSLVPMDLGTFAVTGQTLTINTSATTDVPLDIGSYSVSGLDSTVLTADVIALDTGAYTLAGFDATALTADTIGLDSGAFTIAGQTISLLDTIVYVGRGTTLAAGSGTPTVSPSLPPTWAEGDIFYLIIQSTGHDGNPSPSPGAGWELVGTDASGTGGTAPETRVTVYWRRATASESAPTVGYTGDHALAVVTAWRGAVDTGTPHEATQTSIDATANTSFSVTGLTTLGGLRMIVSIVTNGDDGATSAETNASLVSIISSVSEFTTTFNDGTLSYNWGIKKDAGAVSATTGTFSKSAEDANLMLAITPNEFGVPPTNIALGNGAFTLSGLDATTARTDDLDSGAFTLSGLDVAVDTGVPVPLAAGSYVITGYSGNTSYYIPPLNGSFTLTGYDATVSLAGNTSVPLDSAAFTVAGNALGIGSGLGGLAGTLDQGPDPDELDWVADTSITGTLYWVFTASATPPPLQGTPAGFSDNGLANGNFAITAGAGSGTVDLSSVGTGDGFLHAVAYRTSDGAFTRVDSDAIAIPGELLAGTFTVAGFDTTISEGVNIPAAAGSFALTGLDLTATASLNLTLDAGALTLTGYDATALVSEPVALDADSYALTGFDLTATTDTIAALDAGSYTLAGQTLAVNTAGNTAVPLDSAAFNVAGFDLTALTADIVELDAGSFAISGLPAGVAANTNAPLDSGSYSLSGHDATILAANVVPMDAGAFSLSGFDASASLGAPGDVLLVAGAYSVSGYDVAADFIISTLAVEPEQSRTSGQVVMGNLTGVLVQNTKTGKVANG